LLLTSCSTDTPSLAYDPELEMAKTRALMAEYRPDILEEPDSYMKILLFRDHIHWVNQVRAEPLSLPFLAQYYQETVEGARGNLCQGMSIHLAAFLQAYGYTWRHLELWAGYKRPSGVDVTHSVLEVWVEGRWELHDTTYNCVFRVEDSPPLNAAEIQEAIENGLEIVPDLQGFEAKEAYRFYAESEFGSLPEYEEYFNEIRYTFEEVFL
jgi:hypothetical protein